MVSLERRIDATEQLVIPEHEAGTGRRRTREQAFLAEGQYRQRPDHLAFGCRLTRGFRCAAWMLKLLLDLTWPLPGFFGRTSSRYLID